MYDIVPLDWVDGDVEEGMEAIVNWRRGKTVTRSPAVIKKINGKRRDPIYRPSLRYNGMWTSSNTSHVCLS